MAGEDLLIDSGGTEPATDSRRSRTFFGLGRNEASASRHSPGEQFYSAPHEVPEKLTEAWSWRVASHLR